MTATETFSDWQRRLTKASIALEKEDQTSPYSETERFDVEPTQSGAAKKDRPAAVLVPITQGKEGPKIVLTKRSEHLPSHKGQVAFPGGKIDKTDKSPADAAIRETHEEIGVKPTSIKLIGKLPLYTTGTGYLITPITANLEPPYHFKKEVGEVEEIFEVPLDHAMNLKNYQQHAVNIAGLDRTFWQLTFQDYYIWGATAAILINLANRVQHSQ